MQHTPLSKRETPLSSDVADAIGELVDNTDTLPIALSKANIVEQLLIIASRDEAGMAQPQTSFARRGMFDLCFNRLTNTAVFQAGYKRYEGISKTPVVVVPITDYFLKFVDDMTNLAAMNQFDTQNSLPKRPSIARHEVTGEERRDLNNQLVHFGEIAGIVVFPAKSDQPLLRAWLRRQINGAIGSANKVAGQVGAMRPDLAIDRVKQSVSRLGGQLQGAMHDQK